jgi:glycosyltransferase involved in cell wall biosynthesis
MKIAMILDSPYPPDPRVELEARLLHEAGHEVILFVLQKQDITGFVPPSFLKLHNKGVSKWEYLALGLIYTMPFAKSYLARYIREFLEKVQPDVVHVHDMRIAPAVVKAMSNMSVPMVLDLHENRPEIMKEYPTLQIWWKRMVIAPSRWAKAEKQLILQSRATVVVTPEAKAHYMSELGLPASHFVVVPNAVSRSFLKQAAAHESTFPQNSPFQFLYIGDTGMRRGLPEVFESMRWLQEQGRLGNIRLCILGKSSDDDKLKHMVKERHLEKVVEFAGWLPAEELHTFLAKSHAGLSPLRRNIHHDTTYPNKIFQYMAYGLPVIVSDCPSSANVIHNCDTGIVYPALDKQALAEAMELVATDSKKYQTWSNNGKAAFEGPLDPDKWVGELTKFYSALNV